MLVSIIGSAWLIGQAVFLFAAHFGEYKTFLRAECKYPKRSVLTRGFRYSGIVGAASKIPGSVSITVALL